MEKPTYGQSKIKETIFEIKRQKFYNEALMYLRKNEKNNAMLCMLRLVELLAPEENLSLKQ